MDPYAICIGSTKMITSSVIVCNQKVITEETGHYIFFDSFVSHNVFTTLIYSLSYNPASQQVMEFLQKKQQKNCLEIIFLPQGRRLLLILTCIELLIVLNKN